MFKKSLVLSMTVFVLFATSSCSVNRSLYPVQSERKIDAKMLEGKWEGIARNAPDSEGTIVNVKISDAGQKEQLLVNLVLTPEDDKEQADNVFPLIGTIYEVEGNKFLNLAADEKALYQLIGQGGYSAKGVTRGLLHRWVFLFKIDFTADKIELSSVSFAEPGKNGRTYSGASRFDRSQGALLNSSPEISAIIKEKGFVVKPLLTLSRVK